MQNGKYFFPRLSCRRESRRSGLAPRQSSRSGSIASDLDHRGQERKKIVFRVMVGGHEFQE